VSDSGKVLRLEEKPVQSESNLAIPGLYFFDSRAPEFAKSVQPSPRGELEIVDLLELYRIREELVLEKLPLGTAWFDSGTFSDMNDASNYVRLMEERTGLRVGDPDDIARLQGWIK
jgi:glucose-1-phosphate thymidylyltransferase